MTLSKEIFSDETPLSNLERRELFYRKIWGMKEESYWALTHPGEDGLVVAPAPRRQIQFIPPFLRRQAG